MSIISCQTMRFTVVGSGVLFVAGAFLLMLTLLTQGSDLTLAGALPYLSFAAMILSAFVILAAATLAMLPGVRDHLEACQH